MTGPAVTDESDVSVGDAIGWLHEEGLARLCALSEASAPAAAFTVDVATGMVTAFPVTGADSVARAADDLPPAADNPGRLVVVGLTSADALLVVDLSGSLMMALNGDRPELAARSWAAQLLLNPEISLTTNSSAVALDGSPRCRKSFIPGGGGDMISVDDGNPPVTTISMNSDMEGSDYLERAPDGSGEMYLGPRYWQLRHVMTIADGPWSALAATLDEAGK